MEVEYEEKPLYLHYISIDGKWVLATRDPEKKKGFFKVDTKDINDKESLNRLMSALHDR
jgi:hypothetical protein